MPPDQACPSPQDPSSSRALNDPILRNTLRYTVSAREYAALHKYVLSRSRALRRATPSPAAVDKALRPSPPPRSAKTTKEEEGQDAKTTSVRRRGDDFNARTVRHALRVFAVTWVGMKGWEAVARRMGQQDPNANGKKKPFYKSGALRLSLSLSTILLLYRFLFRFLTRLRVHLLDPQVEPFRRRNPGTARTLTSPYAPAVGASLAGLALGVYPSQQLRVSVAIYAMFRALEFGWNMCEGEGMVWGVRKDGRMGERPWWWGSWLLQPLALGQLVHAGVFDRECLSLPKAYGDLLLSKTSGYVIPRPGDWPAHMQWPDVGQIVSSLAEMARLSWPAYISPTMFPNKPDVLPPTLAAVSPLTSRAHPLITSLSCATLHPSDPSCLRTYLTFWLSSFPPLTRLFLILYSALKIIPQLKMFYNAPLSTLHAILTAALRTSTFVTGAASTAWASICFFQSYLPRHILSTQRFFLSGFLAGLWAFIERKSGHGMFIYTARASVDSLWKVGAKRRWWKAMRGGDVWVFVMALMVTGVVYERDARAIKEGSWRKGMSWVRGEGWRDWGAEEDEGEDEEVGEKED